MIIVDLKTRGLITFDCFTQDTFHFGWLHARTFATAKPGLFSELGCIDLAGNNAIMEVFILFFRKLEDVDKLTIIVAT